MKSIKVKLSFISRINPSKSWSKLSMLYSSILVPKDRIKRSEKLNNYIIELQSYDMLHFNWTYWCKYLVTCMQTCVHMQNLKQHTSFETCCFQGQLLTKIDPLNVYAQRQYCLFLKILKQKEYMLWIAVSTVQITKLKKKHTSKLNSVRMYYELNHIEL